MPFNLYTLDGRSILFRDGEFLLDDSETRQSWQPDKAYGTRMGNAQELIQRVSKEISRFEDNDSQYVGASETSDECFNSAGLMFVVKPPVRRTCDDLRACVQVLISKEGEQSCIAFLMFLTWVQPMSSFCASSKKY